MKTLLTLFFLFFSSSVVAEKLYFKCENIYYLNLKTKNQFEFVEIIEEHMGNNIFVLAVFDNVSKNLKFEYDQGEYSYNNLQDRGEYYFARKETKSVLDKYDLQEIVKFNRYTGILEINKIFNPLNKQDKIGSNYTIRFNCFKTEKIF